jgi:hypothetical protein
VNRRPPARYRNSIDLRGTRLSMEPTAWLRPRTSLSSLNATAKRRDPGCAPASTQGAPA